MGVDEAFAVLVVGVVVLAPNKLPDEPGLEPPPKILELDVGVWAPPKSPPPVDGVVEAPNKGFWSVGLVPVFPNRLPAVFEEVGVVLLLGVVLPNEKLVAPPAPVPVPVPVPVLVPVPVPVPVTAAPAVDCPPKRLGEAEEGVVDEPNRPPVAGALLVVALFCPEELAPKLKDMITIASVGRESGLECASGVCCVYGML